MTQEEIDDRIQIVKTIRGLLLYYAVSEFFINPIHDYTPIPPDEDTIQKKRVFRALRAGEEEVPKLAIGYIVSMPDYLRIDNAPYCVGQKVVYRIALSVPFPYVQELEIGDDGMIYNPEIVSVIPGGVIGFERYVDELIAQVNAVDIAEMDQMFYPKETADPVKKEVTNIRRYRSPIFLKRRHEELVKMEDQYRERHERRNSKP